MAPKTTRHTQLLDYVLMLARAISLADWTITLVDKPIDPEDDAEAQIELKDGHSAVLGVCSEFWDLPPEYQRRVIVHEVCHLQFDRLRIFNAVAALLPDKNVSAALKTIVEEAEEHAVESFAKVLAPALPLPPRFKNA